MGRLLQILGCVMMLAAFWGAVSPANRADAQLLAPIEQAVQIAVATAIGASPSPSPPAPAARKLASGPRGGPLLFDVTGSLSLGRSSSTSTFGETGFFTPTPAPTGSPSPGPFPFQQSAAQSQTNLGAGVVADVSRRTASTFTDLKLPVGFSGEGRSAIGVAQILYSTPKYSMGYGVAQLLALGQLQMGSTLRGTSFILPEHYGQATFFQGPAEGADQYQAQLYGVLLQQARGRAIYESGLIVASGPVTGKAKTLEFGAATAGRNLSLIAEGAWQTRSDGDATPHGVAVQLRVDDYAKAGECATTLRSVPDRFVTFSSGEIYSDKYGDLNCHSAHTPIYLDANWERTGDAVYGLSQQSVESLGYSPSVKFGGLSFNLMRQDGSSGGQSVWSNTGSAALQTQFFHISALLGAQFQRSASGPQQNQTQSLLASLRQAIGHNFSLGVSGQIQRQAQQGAPPTPDASPTPFGELTPVMGLQKGVAFDVSQTWRKTTVQLGETITRTISNATDAVQQTPLISVTRQISPGIAVMTSLGYQTLRDRLNPESDGRSRVFSVSLSAPFSYGNSNVTGRIDPRLPATIAGRVLFTGSNVVGSGPGSSFATLAGAGGVGNVMVTLDNKFVERTDMSGGFQFSFVSPGQHQLSIDSSSMPRGFTATVPVQTVVVQGGQAATVSFTIGTFGGILGHVFGTDLAGNPMPLSNVELRVDGGAYSQTDSTGAYGFGGLVAGQHEVTVIPQSVPATADFAPSDLVQKVVVNDGSYTTLDFHAELLGSIAGKILFAKDMGTQADNGVPNAYVVAEPGEHAAIDEDDGSFIIDNLPAGDYTISVDPETIGQGLGAGPDSVSVHLDPGEHYSGLLFSVGRFEKKVVFTLISGNGTPAASVLAVRLSETRLPPRATTAVAIDAPADAKDVFANAFGKRIALEYDKQDEKWAGEIEVPPLVDPGQYPVTGSVHGTPVPTSATLTVDPKLPLVIAEYLPRNARIGEIVTVRARFLVDVHAGDKITWQDGTQTVLDKPVSGRVFVFHKGLTLLPLHGLLLTAKGTLPIELL